MNNENRLSVLVAETAAESCEWTLVRGDAADGSQQIPISPLPFTVGRRPGAGLQINSRTVSGSHATISYEQGRLWVEDIKSTNGTYVNGQRITKKTALSDEDLLQFADVVYRVRNTRRATTCHTMQEDMCDNALALVQFDRLMQNRLVNPYFQPIVDLKTGNFVGYEVLARSRLFGLESCQAMFEAASRLNLEVELSQMLRWEGLRLAMALPNDKRIFLNTHPLEISRDGLIDSLVSVRQLASEVPIVLEVHEASVTDPAAMRQLRAQLRDINIGLAYDDFGAGQTRLSELIEAPPDYLKFDMSMIRGIDKATPERLKMLGSLVGIVLDLGINPLAEGVETPEEADACRSLGFLTSQGYHFGRPAPVHSFQ
jgi:EAL domain-containing protein (putative c-di-GMP-specific phosphodiesterase class I)